ncbi:lytic transglycosylase domain-containing protein [Niveispirillum sp. KHB5.9]|uniref:lytic transglycosylase domain-containing protein n=1 Tax=Niveispirillum sp. KHB5.9 TaxID=3400269 RepID=UPI003A86AC60
MAGWVRLGAVILLLGLTPVPSVAADDPVGEAVREASGRFGVPASWITALIRTESAGDARALSSKGAIGLMQVMPGTYAELRHRHGLGPDPWDIRDNILAGAAYLRELQDRYGPRGASAAYNAGPARYAEHLATGKPLPVETRAYLARLALAGDGPSPTVTPDWRQAPLFAGRWSSRR